MTAVEVFGNQSQTTVTAGGTDAPVAGTSQTWTVASAASFPGASSGTAQFRICDPAAPSEIILVTNTSGTTWTVTRGAESTTPVTHASGFTVFLDLTAAALGSFLQQPQAEAQYLPRPSGTPQADWVPKATGVGQASEWGAISAGDLRADGPVAGGINSDNNQSNGTDTGTNSRAAYTAVSDLGIISVVYMNAITGHVGEFTPVQAGANGNPVTVTAAVEYPSGNIIPLTFGGKISATLAYFASVESDPANVFIPAGATYWVRTFCTVTSGQFWWQSGRTADAATGWTASGGTGQSDLTQSGTITGTYSPAFLPIAVRGQRLPVNTLRVAAFGDSITAGYQDGTPVPSFTTGLGWLGRAFTGYRYLQNGRSGALIGDEAGTAAGVRTLELAAARGANAGFACYGTNDIDEGADAPTTEANLMMMFRQMSAQGMTCYAVTIPPVTTSTDNWATLVNQAPLATESVRVSFNQWLRAGMPVNASTLAPVAVGTPGALMTSAAGHPVKRVYDLCSACESSQDSGLWKVNGTAYAYTVDGIHPSPTAYAAMASVINVAQILADVGASS